MEKSKIMNIKYDYISIEFKKIIYMLIIVQIIFISYLYLLNIKFK